MSKRDHNIFEVVIDFLSPNNFTKYILVLNSNLDFHSMYLNKYDFTKVLNPIVA
jgi:hypothetical protein